MLCHRVWGLYYSSTNTTRDTDGEAPHTFKIKFMTKDSTRNLILDKTYKLLFRNNWEAITIEQIESSIGKTRGAIFHFFKNKNELFNAVISERFLCKFESLEISKITLGHTSIKVFFDQYHTPFERIGIDMAGNYGLTNSSPAILNIIVQARKLYPNFDIIIESYIKDELQFIANNALIMRNNPWLINLFKTYIQLSCGALLFQPDFCAFDIKKQCYSYINGLALLLGE